MPKLGTSTAVEPANRGIKELDRNDSFSAPARPGVCSHCAGKSASAHEQSLRIKVAFERGCTPSSGFHHVQEFQSEVVGCVYS